MFPCGGERGALCAAKARPLGMAAALCRIARRRVRVARNCAAESAVRAAESAVRDAVKAGPLGAGLRNCGGERGRGST